jgi:uncharacterized protein (TIGR03083 family)
MAAHPEVDESLRQIRLLVRQLQDDFASLPEEAWDAPSNCPPWPVRRLAAHLVENAEFIRRNVEAGVAGQTEATLTTEQRQERLRELAAAPGQMATALADLTAAFETVMERLSADQLEAICYHPAGNRSARWYAQQRLAEIAMHRWDLQRSLGRDAELDETVAAFLLPMLLESNLPRTYRRGPRGEGRFRLAVAGRPAQSWLLAASPDELRVERGGDDADVKITAPAAVLALLIYARANLAEAEAAGQARVEGSRARAEQFHTIFPGP